MKQRLYCLLLIIVWARSADARVSTNKKRNKTSGQNYLQDSPDHFSLP